MSTCVERLERLLPILLLGIGATILSPRSEAMAPARAAAVIESLPPGHWLRVPDSKMSMVYYRGPLASSIRGYEGPAAIMNDWSGGTLDTKRNRLVIWGGGHHGYAGNEVYAFDLDTLSWSRLDEPSAVAGYGVNNCYGSGVYPDGKPVSRHTNGGLTYIPEPVDRMFAVGGGLWPCGYNNPIAWSYDFSTNTWQRRASAPSVGAGSILAYDSVTGHVFNEAGGTHGFLSEYDPRADRWIPRGSVYSPSIGIHMSGALDPNDHLLVAVGNNDRNSANEAVIWNLDSAIGNALVSPVRRLTTGPQVVMRASNPGFVWVPDMQRFVAWIGGANIFTLDPKTWAWGIRTPAKDNTVIPTVPNRNGTFGRFQYVPSKHVFVLVNRTTDDVYIYRPSIGPASGSCSAPKVTGATAVTGLVDEPLRYAINASNQPAIYFASGLPDGLSLDPDTGVISGSPLMLGTFKASIGAANDCGSSATQEVAFTITGHYHFHIGRRGYPDLQSAVDAAPSDGIIEVDAGTYTDMYATIRRPLTIRGRSPGRAVLRSDRYIPNGKAIIVVNTAGNVTLEDLELAGAKVSDRNGAGVRYEKGRLTIDNVYFYDNENGILGGASDPAGTITIRNSLFERNGYGNGYSHGAYLGAIGRVVIDHSTFRDTRVGHHIKSRALETDISNVLTDDGTVAKGASYEIDAPNGGVVNITCTKMIRNANAQNHVMVTFGEERKLHATNALTITNSVFVDNDPATKVIGVRNEVDSMTARGRDNVFVRFSRIDAIVGRAALTDTTWTTSERAMPSSCGPIGDPNGR